MSCDNQCRPVEFVHDDLTSVVAKKWHACAFRAWCKYEARFRASRVEMVEGKTTSDRINRQTTKPVGGSRLSERLVPEIYRGFQGCRADVYPARCKFRSAFSQIYDLPVCFSLSSRPLSLPPTGATGVGDEGCGMISQKMRILPWSFKPPPHGFGAADNNAVCVLPPEYLFSPSPKSSSPLFLPLFSHLLSAVVPRAGPLQSRDIACVFIIWGILFLIS